MSEFYDALETRTPADREQALIQAVAKQVAHAKANTAAYANSLKGIDPTTIKSAEDIAKLPITRKSELIEMQKANRPFGGLADKGIKPTHIFASPGPIYEPGTKKEDFARFARSLYAAGFRSGGIAHNCFSYHFTPAGILFDSSVHAMGSAVIPAGTGQTELQVQTISDLKPDCYIGTPSFLKIILDKAEALGSDVSSLNKALVTGEALPPSIREGFAEKGIAVRQCYSSADLGLIAYESDAQEGLIIDEGIYLEIVRPGTGDPVEDGEVGEVIVTSLNPEYPLIRFATGDLSAIMDGQSPCGRTNKRIKGWMGRADQTAKVRGMFIHPEQVDKVFKRHPELAKVRLVVSWENESDQLTLKCETDQSSDELGNEISTSIRDICKLRGEVEFVEIGSLPNDGTVIEDARDYD